MKKILTIMLLTAVTVTAQGQQPNPRLTRLEEFMQQQRLRFDHKQSNSVLNNEVVVTNQISTNTHRSGDYHASYKESMSKEEKEKAIHRIDSGRARIRERMENIVDSIRTTFVSLSRSGSESYMYEYHKKDKDTIQFSYMGPSREAVRLNYHTVPHKSRYKELEDCHDYIIYYSHSYSESTGIAEDGMRAFDEKAFCEHIQPVLKKFMKLKGAKAYPVHWQHDENFEKNEDFFLTPKYGRNKHEFETHPGMATGTHYIIPSEHEAIANVLYKQLDSLAYDYVNNHPEQPYTYKFTSEFEGSNNDRIIHGLPEIIKGNIYKGGDEFHFYCKREEDGLYHILTIKSKGVHWVPVDWASLKSYINGEKVYIKGMEPKK